MTKKELLELLEPFPDDHNVDVYIQFCTEEGREINMGEVCDIECVIENGLELDVWVRSQAWKSAFDKAMIEEDFLDEHD